MNRSKAMSDLSRRKIVTDKRNERQIRKALVTQVEELNNLETDLEDALFELIYERKLLDEKSKEILGRQLQQHYESLVNYDPQLDIELPSVDPMGLKRKMKAHRSRLEMLEEMRKSNEKNRAQLTEFSECLNERLEKMNNLLKGKNI